VFEAHASNTNIGSGKGEKMALGSVVWELRTDEWAGFGGSGGVGGLARSL